MKIFLQICAILTIIVAYSIFWTASYILSTNVNEQSILIDIIISSSFLVLILLLFVIFYFENTSLRAPETYYHQKYLSNILILEAILLATAAIYIIYFNDITNINEEIHYVYEITNIHPYYGIFIAITFFITAIAIRKQWRYASQLARTTTIFSLLGLPVINLFLTLYAWWSLNPNRAVTHDGWDDDHPLVDETDVPESPEPDRSSPRPGDDRDRQTENDEVVAQATVAEQVNDSQRLFDLGVSYAKGQGVSQDYVVAFKYFHRAAEQGHAKAQTMLGLMFASGKGTPRNLALAHTFLSLAAERGEYSATKSLPGVTELMTPQEIAYAERLAKGWSVIHQ